MNIYTVTDDFYGSVCELFTEHGEVKILPKDSNEYKKLKIDLLIFTGGEDIDPERYGLSDKSIRFNAKRDSREFSVLSHVLRGGMNVNKVLGICRGLQLLNVGMGGTLIPDIFAKYGESHEPVHPLEWLMKSPLSILTETNSLHHQGIAQAVTRIADHRNAKVLAVEPRTKVVEAITWGDNFLAVQFHPEFFPDSPIKRDIASIISSWCAGKLELSAPSAKKTISDKTLRTSSPSIYEQALTNSMDAFSDAVMDVQSSIHGSWINPLPVSGNFTFTEEETDEELDEELDEESQEQIFSDEELEEE